MAKVNYRSQFKYSFAGQPVALTPIVAIGASGAPTIQAATGMGVDSMVRNSAGNYTLTLSGPAFQLLNIRASFQSGTSAPAAPSMNIVSSAVNAIAAPVIVLQFRDITGAAADPASGEIMYLQIDLNRSSTGC